VNVLVIGSGAREHAIVRALLADPEISGVDAAPGNPGIAEIATCHPLDGGVTDVAAVVRLAQDVGTDLAVIGPEAPLVAGVADALRDAGIAVFGPSGQAAQLEGSKAFAKEIMAAADVPTSRSYVCNDDAEAAAALEATGAPYVVKDDGLAAGKGVVVTDSMDEALAHARVCFAAGGSVVVEEFLSGPEVSLLCLTDGTTVVPLAPAQDFKRVGDDDAGPNTGGMGAYSPLPWAPQGLVDDVVARIAQPTVDEMRRRGTPFAGVLYVGLALTRSGPRVIEFNARFGDPETQVVLARLRTPLGSLLRSVAAGELDQQPPLVWRDDAAVTVVVASEGYPTKPRTGDPIDGLTDGDDQSYVLHAGTALDSSGALVSAGGRVLSCVGIGSDLTAARAAAYRMVEAVSLRGAQHRTDIARAAADGLLEAPSA